MTLRSVATTAPPGDHPLPDLSTREARDATIHAVLQWRIGMDVFWAYGAAMENYRAGMEAMSDAALSAEWQRYNPELAGWRSARAAERRLDAQLGLLLSKP